MLINYKKLFSQMLLDSGIPMSQEDILSNIELVPENIKGDLGFPCFKLSKELKKAPNQIAQDFVSQMGNENIIAVGPYINFLIPMADFSKKLIDEIIKKGNEYGKSENNGKEIVLEGWQPNTHKAIHIGHLRNILVGNGVATCLKWAGYNVHGVTYPGDIGAHVAKWIWYFKNFTDQSMPEVGFGEWAGKLYSDATSKIDENPDEYKSQIQKLQKDLEDGDPDLVKIWNESREKCLKYMSDIFEELECPIEKRYFESEVEKPGIKIVKEMLDNGKATIGEGGSIIINLEEYKLGIFLLLKSTGASLYSTKDIGLAHFKKRDFPNYDKSLYIVGSEQEHHFQQLFKTLELIGFPYEKLHHISYGLVDLKDGKMSSRAGNVILYTELRDKMVQEAEKLMEGRNIPQDQKKSIAKSVAFAAMKFDMLLPDAGKKILFDINDSLSFEGETGPYLQYTHARCCSLLKKGTIDLGNVDYNELNGVYENGLLKHLSQFNEYIQKAATEYRPNYVARYLLDLSKLFNTFYNNTDKKIVESSACLLLVSAVKQVMANGLSILGIDSPDQM